MGRSGVKQVSSMLVCRTRLSLALLVLVWAPRTVPLPVPMGVILHMGQGRL